MYWVKISGKGWVFEYYDGLIEYVKEQVFMFSDLCWIICNWGLEFYLQGKYNVVGSLIGVELLCCWFLLLYGIVSFGVFIFLVE